MPGWVITPPSWTIAPLPVEQAGVEVREVGPEPGRPDHGRVSGERDGGARLGDDGRRWSLVGWDCQGAGELVDLVEQPVHLEVGVGAQVGE